MFGSKNSGDNSGDGHNRNNLTINLHPTIPDKIFPQTINFSTVLAGDVIGREKELSEVVAKIKSGQKLILVSGIGGIGKTKFMRLVATELSENEQNQDEKLQYIYFLQVDSSRNKNTKTTFKQLIIDNLAARFEIPQQSILENEQNNSQNILKQRDQIYAKIINKLGELNSPKMLILDDIDKDWLQNEFVPHKADFQNWIIIGTIGNGEIASAIGK